MEDAEKSEIKLVNEGSYGCIYRPGPTCSGKKESARYITKIQKNKRSVENEVNISKRIRTITGYTRFFAPILKQCDVKITKDTVNALKQCDVFKDDKVKEISEYVSMKIRYVGNNDLMKYLLRSLDTLHFLENVWKTHLYLLKATQKMVSNKIVHYDIKYNNIMYDEILRAPILIDFGLSFATDDLLDRSSDLEKIFFVFEYYSWWPIDILVCSYIVQEIGVDEADKQEVSLDKLDEIYDVFMKGTRDRRDDDESVREVKNDVFKINILNSEVNSNRFRESYSEYFSKFVGRTWWTLYEDMVQHTNTWDSYSLAATYLVVLDECASANPEAFQSQIEKHSDSYGRYVHLLEDVLYSSPEKRPSLRTAMKQMPKLY